VSAVGLTSAEYTLVARIAKISVSDYRAFPSGPPCEIDLGADGKNLLLYGENGSGKSSLAHALRDLFNARNPPANFEPSRNVFTAGEDGAVSVQFTAGVVPAELRWEYGEAHPKTTQGQAFFEFASRCLFLNYRDLLRTSFGHPSGPPNLFDLLVQSVLDSLPVLVRGRKGTLGVEYQQLLSAKPRNHRGRKPWRAKLACDVFNAVLAAHLPEVVTEANRIFEKLGQPGTRFTLTAKPVSYDRLNREFAGCSIEFETELFGHKVAEPQHFLNEARLTALALAIYLGAARCAILPAVSPVGGALPTRLLVLDDVLIGLDLANRLPLLRVLEEDFADWQIILLTHDVSWFEMASDVLDGKRWAKFCLHARLHQSGREIPVLDSDAPYLDRAWGYIQSNDYKAAGVYLRSAFETLLRDFCVARSLRVGLRQELRDYSSEDLWPLVRRYEVKKGQLLVDDGLAAELSLSRRYVLNPLCHDDPARPTREEVRRAHASLTRLSVLLDVDLSWRRELDSKLCRATKEILGDNDARRDKALKGLAPASEFALQAACVLLASDRPPTADIGFLLRSAFDKMLWRYSARKSLSFSVKCDTELDTISLWTAAKSGPAGLAATQGAFVSLVESHTDLLLEADPVRDTCARKTQAELEGLCTIFAGSNWKTEQHPQAAMDHF